MCVVAFNRKMSSLFTIFIIFSHSIQSKIYKNYIKKIIWEYKDLLMIPIIFLNTFEKISEQNKTKTNLHFDDLSNIFIFNSE